MALAGPASAAAAAPEFPGSDQVAYATPAGSDYWTPARMKAATPAPAPTVPAGPTGQVARHPWAAPVPQAKKWSGGGAVLKTVGRVFFSTKDADLACSASVVTSANRDTVVTAGHCVYLGATQEISNWVFVPGYYDGDAPYGKWSAQQLTPTPGWKQNQNDLNEDVGFARVQPLNGKHLEDAVGSNAIGFDTPIGDTVWSFGYPAQRTFNGEFLYYCRGATRANTHETSSTDIGIDCDMNGGSSGGPWMAKLNPKTGGTVVSVNSFGYDDLPSVMWGPRFDASIKAVYNTVQAA
ncbi:MAG TPA: trypsin-like serine protease [Mycobacteriales bacterium]|nr:trypsin-like serine protease [Mycobacteriales bacterium]